MLSAASTSTSAGVFHIKADKDNRNFITLFTASSFTVSSCAQCENKKIHPLECQVSYSCRNLRTDPVPIKLAQEILIQFNETVEKKKKTNYKESNKIEIRKQQCPGFHYVDYSRDIRTASSLEASEFVAMLQNHKNQIVFKLKITEKPTLMRFPSMDRACRDALYELVQQKYLKGQLLPTLNDSELFESLEDFPEYQVPGGFKVALHPHQRRTLSWMAEVESKGSLHHGIIYNNFLPEDLGKGKKDYLKVKLADTPFHFGLFTKTVSESSETVTPQPIRLRGGVLSDGPGRGKSVTALALIHSRPSIKRNQIFCKSDFVVVKTVSTLIVCKPEKMVDWKAQALKCNPNFQIVTASDRTVKTTEIALADIVLVSYDQLSDIKISHNDSEDPEPWTDLGRFKFYRVILDDFDSIDSVGSVDFTFKFERAWALSGDLDKYMALLHKKNSSRVFQLYERNESAATEMRRKFCRANKFLDPKSRAAVEYSYETVWVDLLDSEVEAIEKIIQKQSRCESVEESILETFYQINSLTIFNERNYSDIKSADLNKAFTELTDRFSEALLEYREAKRNMTLNTPSSRDHSANEASIKNFTQLIQEIESKQKFRLQVFEELMNYSFENRKNCLVCIEAIHPAQITLMACGHVYCLNCIKSILKADSGSSNISCPLCKFKFKRDEIVRIILPNGCANLSTKFLALFQYIKSIQKQSGKKNRAVIYVQSGRLATLMLKTLKKVKIRATYLSGPMEARRDSILKFNTSPECRIIVVRADSLDLSDDNSSLLFNATHFILFNPILTDWNDSFQSRDLECEKRGLAFLESSSERSIKVVRFAASRTFEEFITKNRLDHQ